MFDPYVDNQNPLPYQPNQPAPNQAPAESTVYQETPGEFQTPPVMPPVNPRRPGGKMRTGAIIALTLVLVLIFGVGLFAGWQFGRSGMAIANPSSGSLQTGSTPAAPVPALTGNNLQAVREAVIAKVRPSVVEVNVSSSNGSGIGSGVIIDKRGYIVTNNHWVNAAQKINILLNNSPNLQPQP